MARPKLNPDFVEKICPHCNKTFKVSFYKRNITRFCGKKCAQQYPDTKLKMINSQKIVYDTKYGGKHPMQTVQTQNNFKNSMVKKYGVDHPGKMADHKSKLKKTLLERYGDENYMNISKVKQTCLKKYGVSCYLSSVEYKEKVKQTCLKRYGVNHPSKSQKYKISHCKNMFDKFLTHQRFSNFIPVFELEDYQGVTKLFNKRYTFKCKRCGCISDYFIDNGKSPLCINCDKDNMSLFQKSVVDFIKSILKDSVIVITDDRTVLYPKEIDIYIPSLKLAIECNGLYWHSERLGGKNKTYHLNKMKRCMLKEIRLIQIWEDEWNSKTEIIKSILKNLLVEDVVKIYARECELKILSKKESDSFLLQNHIQGKDISSLKFGLFYNKELVSLMTFCKSKFDKKRSDWEMARFCNKINTSVVGGASKLFSYFVKNYHPKRIVSYSDRRLFTGHLYSKLGFVFDYNTVPNYFYIIDNYSSRNRMQFQKHKLKKILPNFDPELTEWENMQNHGFDRIWDCGHSRWLFVNKDSSMP